MKKPYISPEMQTVAIHSNQMMAESAPQVSANPEATPVQGSDLDVKEKKEIWDEEW